jgi:hypothetical protein
MAPACGSVLQRVILTTVNDVPQYRGVPLEALEINTVTWSEAGADHIRKRTARYGSVERNVEPEWATEAALDPARLVRPSASAKSEDTRSLQIIGYSPSCGLVLKVWVWAEDPRNDTWDGVSACFADRSTTNRYRKENGHGED